MVLLSEMLLDVLPSELLFTNVCARSCQFDNLRDFSRFQADI